MPLTNPFYSSDSSIPPVRSSQNPPSYTNATRPTPAPPPVPPSKPTQYGSLKDLTSGKSQTGNRYQYVPQPESQGYRAQPQEDHHTQASGSGGGATRNIPPPPSNHGKGIPREPPRRVVAEERELELLLIPIIGDTLPLLLS